MVQPNVFQVTPNPYIKSYDWADTASGVGYLKLYPVVTSTSPFSISREPVLSVRDISASSAGSETTAPDGAGAHIFISSAQEMPLAIGGRASFSVAAVNTTNANLHGFRLYTYKKIGSDGVGSLFYSDNTASQGVAGATRIRKIVWIPLDFHLSRIIFNGWLHVVGTGSGTLTLVVLYSDGTSASSAIACTASKQEVSWDNPNMDKMVVQVHINIATTGSTNASIDKYEFYSNSGYQFKVLAEKVGVTTASPKLNVPFDIEKTIIPNGESLGFSLQNLSGNNLVCDPTKIDNSRDTALLNLPIKIHE